MNENTEKSVENFIMVMVALILCIVLIFFSFRIVSSSKSETENEKDVKISSQVNSICELATVRAYYHNVAKLEKQPDGLFKYGLFKYGYKKIWMEYSGIVEVGIDVNEVKVSEPDEKGVVEIYVPDARILNVTAKEEALTKPLVDSGAFTDISATDEATAFSAAQENMEAEANEDQNLLSQAQNRAKDLLEEYVVNTGKQIGAEPEYTVKWINKQD